MNFEVENQLNGWDESSSKVSNLACRNLHAEENGPQKLTGDIDAIISRLELQQQPSPLFSSLDNTNSEGRTAHRRPSRARRWDWYRKAKYQKARCPKRLRPWQLESLFEADHFARSIGLPLNTFVTVSWNNTRQGPDDIPQRFQQATKAMGQWMRRRCCPATWIFVHENPDNSRPNCHLLVHVPPGQLRSFKAMALTWFDALEGGVDIRTRNGPTDRCLSYMVKGTDYITAHRYGAKARNQGVIDFKRCGWTQNLGLTARRSFQAQASKIEENR